MATQGGYFKVNFTVKNTGNVNYQAIVGVSLVGPAVIDGEWCVRAVVLNPGETMGTSLFIPIPTNAPIGSYTLTAVAWEKIQATGTQDRQESNYIIIYRPGTGALWGARLHTKEQAVSITAGEQEEPAVVDAEIVSWSIEQG